MMKRIGLLLLLCVALMAWPVMAEEQAGGLMVEPDPIVITRDEIFETARTLVKSGEPASGFALFELLADRGDAQAQNNLGWLYEEGQGVEKSQEKANEYYRMAAEPGTGRGAVQPCPQL